MRPEWFRTDAIPFDVMWADDPYWYPLFLEGKKFTGRFLFGEHDRILDHVVTEVSRL